MTVHVEEKDRKLIPRWRDLATSVRLGELTPTKEIDRSVGEAGQIELLEKLADWKQTRNIASASDLVAYGLGLAKPIAVRDQALFVLDHRADASRMAIQLAERVLGSSDSDWSGYLSAEPTREAPFGELTRIDWHDKVHRLRQRLKEEPRNAFLWSEIARSYAVLGVSGKSLKAMECAVSLAPENRFVLRAGARFFVHSGIPDRGHSILCRSDRTPHDPWLLSAEIALASIIGKSSKWIRPAERLLARGESGPKHLTELAGAVATLELEAGRMRRAKKLFRQALIDPTENTIAQADWASRRMSGVNLEEKDFRRPFAYEASAWKHYWNGEWKISLDAAKMWHLDQPFSTRPPTLYSFIASVIFEDHKAGADVLQDALAANPYDFGLLNNYVFALSNLGRVEEAQSYLRRIDSVTLSDSERVVWLATSGLVSFRSGALQEGRNLYAKAIREAAFNPRLRHMAELHLAQEELRVGSDAGLGSAAVAIGESNQYAKEDPVIRELHRRLELLVAGRQGGRRSEIDARQRDLKT